MSNAAFRRHVISSTALGVSMCAVAAYIVWEVGQMYTLGFIAAGLCWGFSGFFMWLGIRQEREQLVDHLRRAADLYDESARMALGSMGTPGSDKASWERSAAYLTKLADESRTLAEDIERRRVVSGALNARDEPEGQPDPT